MPTSDLDALALQYGTDKASNSHHYTRHYHRYFQGLPAVGSLLELGWGGHEDPNAGGASARMWRDWLPRWTIQIIDNEVKKLAVRDRGIRLGLGSQDDEVFLAGIVKTSGPFDIIIDDASHLSSLTIRSFELLWPHLKPGGWYVVEDTHQAYHDFFYGPEEANPDPDEPTSTGAPTAMQFLRRLADEVNYRGSGDFDLFPERFSNGYGDVEEIHFHFNIAFIRKSL